MSSTARARRSGERGAAVLEMALITPLFLLLIFGMINFGFAFSVRENMIHSAQEGLRSALVASSADQLCTAKSAARSRMVGIIGPTRAGSESASSGCTDPTADLTVATSTATCPGFAGSSCMTITMTYPYRSDEVVGIPGFDNLAPSTITITVTERLS
jgi:Flp pilus assembly protein TadG